MGKCRLSRFWRCQSSSNTSGTCNDNEQPSTSGVSSAFDSLQKMDLRDLCDRVFRILQNIEDAERENVEHTLQSTEKEFWQRCLAWLPILQELLKQGKPNQCILERYFPKGENDISTLVYIIFRDVPRDLRLRVGLLSVGASLTNWANIDQRMKEECRNVFRQLCILSKYLYELRSPLIENVKLQQFLVKATEILVEGSIMCCIHVNNSYFKSYYLQGCSYRECLKWLLNRVKSSNKLLRSWSDSFIFEGVRSSPLPGRPCLNYPHHAEGIERQKQEIIRLLEWNSQRNTVAVIVSGPPGIGKTTVADAVFTSLHIPLCNYICYTGFESGFVSENEGIRYIDEEGKKETADNNEEYLYESEYDYIEEYLYDSEHGYERSEAGDNVNVDENEDEEQYSQFVEKHNQEYYYDGNARDLVFFESKANAGGRCTEVCNFIYFDNDRDDLDSRLTKFMGRHKSGKKRIVVTTRDMESTWKECAKVLNEDSIYNHVMISSQETMQQQQEVAVEKRSVTTFTWKTVEESEEIGRSAMGDAVYGHIKENPLTTTEEDQQHHVPQLMHNIIHMCEGIPEWIVLVAKYIYSAAAQTCPRSALQQLLGECAHLEGDAKWENMLNSIMQVPLTRESIDAAEIACRFLNFIDIGLGDIRHVLKENELMNIQIRGLVYSPEDIMRFRVAYPVKRYIFSKSIHRVLRDETASANFEEELRVWAQGHERPSIKGIRTDFMIDTSNLHVLADTLRVLLLPWNELHLHGVHGLALAPFNKLLFYRGTPTFFRAPCLRVMEIPSFEKSEDVSWHMIPQSVTRLFLYPARDLSSSAFTNIASLKNLRTLTMNLAWATRVEVPAPMEFGVSNIQELTIWNCQVWDELPESIGHLQCLRILRLHCPEMRRLSQGFGTLPCLMELYLRGCSSLEELSNDFCNLKSLRVMGWIFTETVADKCWKEMVKVKSLRVLVLDPRLRHQCKTWPLAQDVEVYFNNDICISGE